MSRGRLRKEMCRKAFRQYVKNLRFKRKVIAEEYGGEIWSLLEAKQAGSF